MNECHHRWVTPEGSYTRCELCGAFAVGPQCHHRWVTPEGSYTRCELCGALAVGQERLDLGSELFSPEGRPKFRQRTFPGKPLPDNEVIHANQVAAEIEDEV